MVALLSPPQLRLSPVADDDCVADCKRQKTLNGATAVKVFDPQTVAIAKANEEEVSGPVVWGNGMRVWASWA